MTSPRIPRTGLALVGVAAGLVLAMVAGPAPAEPQDRAAVSLSAPPQLVRLPRGTSFAVDLPADARDIVVPDPAVAEAVLTAPRRLTLLGLQPGETDAVVLDSAGRTLLSLRVRVDASVSALQDTLDRVLPNAGVHAEAVNGSIVLTGTVSGPGDADRARRVAAAFVSTPGQVIDMITLAGADQVLVRARIVEVQRTAIKQLGFDTTAVLTGVGDGLTYSQIAAFGVNGRRQGGGVLAYHDASGDGSAVGAALQAFERVGLARILAEPNITTVNGEAAEFLAGGEFPVPVGQETSDVGAKVTIEFKPYGVRLAVRPVVLSPGRLSLQLSTEVSELSSQGAFTLGDDEAGPTLVIPSVNVRRASNTVELPSGGSLMIAGLLREDARQALDQTPALGDLPVLGALFRSRDYLSGETELVIIVEAYVVSPTDPGTLQTPADGLQGADDARALLFGQLNRHNPAREDTATAPPHWSGPVGYAIE